MIKLEIAALQALEALEKSKQPHRYCEDTWYSCPKHEEGCANDAEGDGCNCGADEVNTMLEEAITALREALAEQAEQELVAYDVIDKCISLVGTEMVRYKEAGDKWFLCQRLVLAMRDMQYDLKDATQPKGTHDYV